MDILICLPQEQLLHNCRQSEESLRGGQEHLGEGEEGLLLALRPALDAPRFVRINRLVRDT